jgi:predicted small metal-binding protein
MSNDIIQTIKDVAHRVSEDYIFTKKNMNDSLVEAYINGEVENEEVLKRICEHANQNVYLSLFNDNTINKANITFDIADFNTILPIIRESENAMNDLNNSPNDYRSSISPALTPKKNMFEKENDDQGEENEQTAEIQSAVEKTSELNLIVEYRNTLKNFIDKVACLKGSEEKNAETAFNKMAEDAKILVAKDDSIGDISKIATRYAKELGVDNFMKVAEAYDMIHKDLVAGNYHVKTEFTKMSSLRINYSAEILKPVKEFAMSISKIAGFDEMHKNALKTLDVFDKFIKTELNK